MAQPDRSHVISPVVRRVADEHGIDLSQVTGTGVGGRIRKKDVLAFIESGPTRKERPLHTESPYRPRTAEPPNGERPAANGDRRTPLSPMRRQIAEHMLRSRRTAAHVTTFAEVDMSRVVARRAALKERLRGPRRAAHLSRVRRARDGRRRCRSSRC